MINRIPYTVGSGNVFADLGLPAPEERLAKARLAHRIYRLLEERVLSEREAAAMLGVEPSAVTALLDGQLAGFSIGQLLQFLNALNQDIEIVVRPNQSPDRPASLTVAAD